MGRRGPPGRADTGPVQGPPSVLSSRSPSGWQHGLFLPNKAWAAAPGQAHTPAERRAARRRVTSSSSSTEPAGPAECCPRGSGSPASRSPGGLVSIPGRGLPLSTVGMFHMEPSESAT